MSDLDVFRAGMRAGIWLFATWRDGTQYVGSCGTTLVEALAEVEAGKWDHLRPVYLREQERPVEETSLKVP